MSDRVFVLRMGLSGDLISVIDAVELEQRMSEIGVSEALDEFELGLEWSSGEWETNR